MDNGWTQVSKRGRRQTNSVPIPIPSEKRNLSSVLSNDFYLSKILQFLVEDGLGDCELVNRQWNEISGRLLEKVVVVYGAELESYAQKYPNATSVRLSSNCEKNELASVCRILPTFKRLQSLEWSLSVPSQDSMKDVSFDFPCVMNLTALEISMWFGNWHEDFYSPIRNLTRLTSLKIPGTSQQQPTIRPFTELRYIQRLSLGQLFLQNQNEEDMFPSLTKLTHLECFDDRYRIGQYTECTLKVIMLYAKTLQSLTFNLIGPMDDNTPLLLPRFRKLERLSILNRVDEDFRIFSALRFMSTITELYLDYAMDEDLHLALPVVADAVFALTRLRSLTIEDISKDEDSSAYHFSRLTQLTQLKLYGGAFGTALVGLSNLVDLKISAKWNSIQDISKTFASMTGLETLDFSDNHNFIFPGSVFSSLYKLRSLRVRWARVGGDFFHSISSMSALTHLQFAMPWDRTYPYSFLRRIELVKGLRKLEFYNDHQYDPFKFFTAGILPQLRELQLRWLSHQDARRLKRLFPQLRVFNAAYL